MRHIVFSISRKTAYLASVFVILLAIVIVVLGVLTPYLNSRLPNIEAWASDLLAMPVTIEKVRLSWYQYDPEISLNNVTVLSKETHKPIMQIGRVRVLFSLPKSVWHRQPVLDGVMVADTDFVVKQGDKNQFIVQGFPVSGGFEGQPYANESKFSDVVGWLSAQPRLYLQNVDIRYTGALGKSRDVTLYNLSMKNEGQKHTILGNAILHQNLPTKVTVAAEWIGDVLDYQNIRARAYIYVSGLSLSQWWKGLTYEGWQLNKGFVSAKVWGYWNQGAWQRVQTESLLYNAELYSNTDHSTHYIDRISGDFGWKRAGNQQLIAGDDVLIDLRDHLWPYSSFYVALAPTQKQTWLPVVLNTGYLNIQDVLNLVLASPVKLPDQVSTFIQKSKMMGDITHLQLKLDPAAPEFDQAKVNVGLHRIGLEAYNRLPGFHNISGNVQWDGVSGELDLHSEEAELTLNSVFEKPVPLGHVDGKLLLQHDASLHWQVIIPALNIHNQDVSLGVNQSSLIFDKALPTANLQGSIEVLHADHLSPYLPMHVFSQGLADWLKTAFLSGEVKDGQFTLRGNLADFPFDKNNGLFSIKAHAKDMTLLYAPDWPLVENIDAMLDFTGRRMTIMANEAHTLSIPVKGIQAVIPNLGGDDPTLLQLTNIHASTDFANGLSFVHQSPLEKTLGRLFKDVTVSGPMVLDLGLTVSLDNPDNTQVNGQIHLSDALLNLAPWRLQIEKLSGLVNFTEKSTDADNLQGRLFGEPLTLSLATKAPKNAPSYVQVNVGTHCKLSDIGEWLHLPMDKVATGDTDLKAVLNLGFDQPIFLNLQSDLSGVALLLPAPYGKPATTTIPFVADLTLADNQPLKAKVSYGKLIQAALLLQSKGDSFDLIAANVLLGQGSPDWPTGKGLTLIANFDMLDWATLQSYQSQVSGSSATSFLPLKKVIVNAKKVLLLGQTITSASLNIEPVSPYWEVDIKSDQIVGSVRVPMNLTPQSKILAELSRINLQSGGTSTSSATPLKASAIPALDIDADNFSFNGMRLGNLVIQTEPDAHGMVFKQLQLRANGVSLDAAGSWLQSGSNNTTRLEGAATATALSSWLSGLGMDVHNLIVSKGEGNFKLSWPSSPADLALSQMSGNAYIALGAGRIVDVGETSGAKMDIGKMLSIFSLQTIPRRLSLDFSDVFQQGYSFDSFKGDFTFTKGNAVTNNTRFDGPVAKVGIKGAIGLAAKTYNFTLSVTPYVTSSIPVAAALISGPIAGVAALAVNKIIGSQIAKATTYYYAVGGSWSNPTWNELKTRPAGS